MQVFKNRACAFVSYSLKKPYFSAIVSAEGSVALPDTADSGSLGGRVGNGVQPSGDGHVDGGDQLAHDG